MNDGLLENKKQTKESEQTFVFQTTCEFFFPKSVFASMIPVSTDPNFLKQTFLFRAAYFPSL